MIYSTGAASAWDIISYIYQAWLVQTINSITKPSPTQVTRQQRTRVLALHSSKKAQIIGCKAFQLVLNSATEKRTGMRK